MKPTFEEYLKDAVGSDNAIVAFSAFDKPASVSVRRNPFKKGCALQGRQVVSVFAIRLRASPSERAWRSMTRRIRSSNLA